MTCLPCGDTGHQLGAPWLLCPTPGCAAADAVRLRTLRHQVSTVVDTYHGADVIPMPPVFRLQEHRR